MVKPPEEEPEDKKKPLLPTKKLKPEEAAAVAKVSGALFGPGPGPQVRRGEGGVVGHGRPTRDGGRDVGPGRRHAVGAELHPGDRAAVERVVRRHVPERGPRDATHPRDGGRARAGVHHDAGTDARGLLSGGKPGYGFGPGDFGAPNVNVAAPAVNVEVTMNPGVDADIQTAYRARAGEARLSQLEG